MATLMLQANMHPKVVSERLGHSSISMTLDVYSKVMPQMQTEAAVAIEPIVMTGVKPAGRGSSTATGSQDNGDRPA